MIRIARAIRVSVVSASERCQSKRHPRAARPGYNRTLRRDAWSPLRIRVEHGPGLAGRGDEIERLRVELSEPLRGLLNFAPAVGMVPPDTFEKSGVHKVALIVREKEERA